MRMRNEQVKTRGPARKRDYSLTGEKRRGAVSGREKWKKSENGSLLKSKYLMLSFSACHTILATLFLSSLPFPVFLWNQWKE